MTRISSLLESPWIMVGPLVQLESLLMHSMGAWDGSNFGFTLINMIQKQQEKTQLIFSILAPFSFIEILPLFFLVFIHTLFVIRERKSWSIAEVTSQTSFKQKNCQRHNGPKVFSTLSTFREGSRYQIGWIFGKFQIAFDHPPSFLEKYVANFYNEYGCIYARR